MDDFGKGRHVDQRYIELTTNDPGASLRTDFEVQGLNASLKNVLGTSEDIEKTVIGRGKHVPGPEDDLLRWEGLL